GGFFKTVFAEQVNIRGGEQGAFNSSSALEELSALDALQDAFPAVQKNGYKYVRMDHVTSGGSAVMDVETMKLSYRNANDPANDPLVIVNYSAEGYPKSAQQSDFLNRALPLLAKRSQREIVFIDAVAIRKNAEGLPEGLYLPALLGDLGYNKLGQNDGAIEFNEDEYVLPYGYVSVNGERIYDFSFTAYSEDLSLKKVQKDVLLNLGNVVATSNAHL
ncbi:MAG: hypothetical protein GY789_27825, partial [Hyphomicrobiales bacterium]|nr:hypothetical protein [Hyphomicrobiales bacterium]